MIGLGSCSVFLKGEKTQASSLHEEPGGKGYNQSSAAKKLGTDVIE